MFKFKLPELLCIRELHHLNKRLSLLANMILPVNTINRCVIEVTRSTEVNCYVYWFLQKKRIVNYVRVYNLDRLYRKCLLLSRVWLTPVSEAYVLLPQHETLLFQKNNWDSQWPLLANWFIGYIIQRRRYLISWDLCEALVLAEPSCYLIDEIKCPSIVP